MDGRSRPSSTEPITSDDLVRDRLDASATRRDQVPSRFKVSGLEPRDLMSQLCSRELRWDPGNLM